MPRPRDSQRSKIYTAEEALNEHLSVEELQQFTHSVLSSRWWTTKYGDRSPNKYSNVLIKTTGTAGRCNLERQYRTWVLKLGPGRRGRIHVLHGLIHVVADVGEGWHGRDFSKKWLESVRRFMGEDAYAILRERYKTLRIKRKTVSEESILNRKISAATSVWSEFLNTNEKDKSGDGNS